VIDMAITSESSVAPRAARIGLWALPAYGVLLGLGTLTHQPPVDDFDAYARYVTTGTFLAGHIGGSVGGAGLAILGAVALTSYLVTGRSGRLAVIGLALTTMANVYLASTFGSAAFVQPGIGRAHLAGVPGMPALNDDTAYGPALFVVAFTAMVVLMASAIVLGVAVAKADRRLRWLGVGYAALIPAFVITGQSLQVAQPVTGFALAALTAVLAVRLPRVAVSGRGPAPAAPTAAALAAAGDR
jgi:hypothetical protein